MQTDLENSVVESVVENDASLDAEQQVRVRELSTEEMSLVGGGILMGIG